MYKSKLQEFCQSKSWPLPEYTTSSEGPPHDPRFKAVVVVSGVSYETKEEAKSRESAQNEAARIAYERLNDQAHLCKNQLQTYAQKRNIALPTYVTDREGPHLIRFKSKVSINGSTYEGSSFSKTVKQAEKAAAKVALMALSLNDVEEVKITILGLAPRGGVFRQQPGLGMAKLLQFRLVHRFNGFR